MEKYINANRFLQRLTTVNSTVEQGIKYYNFVYNLVNEEPAADVVEVVRCKDCQWYDNHECQNPYIHMSDAAHMYTYTTDYCSYGLRKPQ